MVRLLMGMASHSRLLKQLWLGCLECVIQKNPQITYESMKESFAQLQAIISERGDIEHGCGTGLVGRCRMILGALKTAEDDPVHSTILGLLRQEADTVFTQQLRETGGEELNVCNTYY